MTKKAEIKTVHPKSPAAWRKWLEKNHATERAVWLLIRRKNSKKAGVTYEEAVLQSLCFGWIDSTTRKNDEETFYIYHARRKPKSRWSRLNRERVARLIKDGLMLPAGQAMIDLAKENGTWLALEDVENTVIPGDLQKLLNKSKTALKNFNAFSPSSKRIILEWIMSAKRPETREKRVQETVELAKKNVKAHVA